MNTIKGRIHLPSGILFGTCSNLHVAFVSEFLHHVSPLCLDVSDTFRGHLEQLLQALV